MFPLYYLPITIDNFGYIPVLACMLFMYPCLWLNYYTPGRGKIVPRNLYTPGIEKIMPQK